MSLKGGGGRPVWKTKVEHWFEMGGRGRQACPVQSRAAFVQNVGHYLGSIEKPFKHIKLQIIG